MKVHEAVLSYHVVREESSPVVDMPDRVAAYMADAFDADPTVEWFYTVLLNRKNHPLGRVLITKGTANSSLVHPREVFKGAILAGASAIVCVHNHPGGDPSPSRADIQVTRQLRDAAVIIGIDLLDHVIVGDAADYPPGYYSFQEAGLL